MKELVIVDFFSVYVWEKGAASQLSEERTRRAEPRVFFLSFFFLSLFLSCFLSFRFLLLFTFFLTEIKVDREPVLVFATRASLAFTVSVYFSRAHIKVRDKEMRVGSLGVLFASIFFRRQRVLDES